MIERERDRERERERGNKSNLSPMISRGFSDRNSTGRELKLLYATRAMQVLESQDFTKVRVFMETRKRRCPRKSRKLRLGFYPTRFNFYLRACVCVSK